MKRFVMTLLAASAAAVGWAADEEVALVQDEMTQITVPFGIRSYMPSNKDVVRIEKTSDSALRLTALKVGRCDLEVTGDNDLRQKYQISVNPPLVITLKNLQRELERVPEVHCTIVGEKIRVDGEIKSIKKWNYLMKVLKGYPVARNFAEFTPGAEILLRMKESLEQSGFSVVFERHAGEPAAWKANCVALAYSKVNRTMTVQAKVYTPEQQQRILGCLKSEKRWLVVDQGDKEAFDDEIQVRCNYQIEVAKPVIRLSVAYMAVEDRDLQQIGNPNATRRGGVLNLEGAFGVIQEFIHGTTQNPRSQSIGATLDVTANFLKQNGITRISDTAYTLMESWDKDGARFKSGGTVFAKVSGTTSGDIKEIPWGFEIKTKGGMIDDDNLSAEFVFDSSTVEYDAVSGDYSRRENQSKQKITFPLGRTTLVGGLKDLVDENMAPSGLPILRNTPILNWFVADSGKKLSDRKLVIMVCPEIVDNTQDTKPDVNKEINIPVQKLGSQSTDQTLEERKPYSGFWSWLNWFQF